MIDLNKRRDRYLKDPLPVRLGGLAANLARIASVSSNPANGQAVYDMLHESKHFIEWTAAEFPCDIAAELVELQIKLAALQASWKADSESEERRREIGQWAKINSNLVLKRSGFLDGK